MLKLAPVGQRAYSTSTFIWFRKPSIEQSPAGATDNSPGSSAQDATPKARRSSSRGFRYAEERCIWRHEFETLEQARAVIGPYVERYHHRPHSGLDYRTPKEVRQTWEDAQERDALQKEAA